MKTSLIPTVLFALLFNGCEGGTNKNVDVEPPTKVEQQLPLNPKIETDYGQIGEYHTMDEYYLDENGGKVWHGYRKNLFPTLSPKIVSFYEHGELMWTETYDEAGNVLTSNR